MFQICTEQVCSHESFDYRISSVLFVRENKDICVCNRPASEQHQRDREWKDSKWDMQHNTHELINPAHGKLPNGALVRQINSPFLSIDERLMISLLNLLWIRLKQK